MQLGECIDPSIPSSSETLIPLLSVELPPSCPCAFEVYGHSSLHQITEVMKADPAFYAIFKEWIMAVL